MRSCPSPAMRECYRLRDDAFSGWLTALYRQFTGGRMPGAEARKEAVAALSWDARTVRRDVFVRVGGRDGKVYIDMGTEAWNAIEVDGDGWRMVDRPPVAFRRPASLKPLPMPQRGATLELFRKYLNLDPEQLTLVMAWMTAAARPTGPHPVLVFAYEQGTAKSTTERVLKETIDPGRCAWLRGQPEDIRVTCGSGRITAGSSPMTTCPGCMMTCRMRCADWQRVMATQSAPTTQTTASSDGCPAARRDQRHWGHRDPARSHGSVHPALPAHHPGDPAAQRIRVLADFERDRPLLLARCWMRCQWGCVTCPA